MPGSRPSHALLAVPHGAHADDTPATPTPPRTLPLLRNRVLQGDCRDWLRLLPDASVDLVVTSPPYADARARTYGGVHPDRYVEWFLPIAAELRRVLRPSGSFVLNIKERVVAGERHTYVLELILALRKQGWLWTEEYCWHKRNCYPGKWPNRFRDAWERCLHFTRSRRFKMDQDAVRVPMGDWAVSRLRKLSATDCQRDPSRVGSGFGKNVSNWLGRELAYPTNVLHLATECANRAHSAAFPQGLPDWFIRLFTEPGDLVLDPFLGSGTAALAAQQLGRDWCGIELNPQHAAQARDALTPGEELYALGAPEPPARRPEQLRLGAAD
jgi:DNA modification methylase